MVLIVALAIAAAVAVSVIAGYVSAKYLGHDNKVEELCEEVIKIQTGVDVDLTPSSPEQQVKEEVNMPERDL